LGEGLTLMSVCVARCASRARRTRPTSPPPPADLSFGAPADTGGGRANTGGAHGHHTSGGGGFLRRRRAPQYRWGAGANTEGGPDQPGDRVRIPVVAVRVPRVGARLAGVNTGGGATDHIAAMLTKGSPELPSAHQARIPRQMGERIQRNESHQRPRP